MPKINLTEIAQQLEHSGLLHDQFLLSPSERDAVSKILSDPKKIKVSRKEHISQFSVIKDENGALFAIYNPKGHNVRNSDPAGAGLHGVIKAAQNLETGEWVALKIQKGLLEGTPNEITEGKTEIDQALAEKKYLGKKQSLLGGQKRIKQFSNKKMEMHYIFMNIVSGVQLMGNYGDKHLLDYVPQMSEKDLLTLYLNILQGLKELKDQDIIHRDLHSQNILVDVDNNYKVTFIDWGSAVDSKNGLWRGHNHTDPLKIKDTIDFRNGVDVEKAINGLFNLIGEEFPEARTQLEEIFGAPYSGDPNSILEQVGDQWSGFNTVDLDPWINKIKSMLRLNEPTVDTKTENVDTPLIAAAKNNNIRDILSLLKDKAAVKMQLLDQDSTGKSALHYLAEQENYQPIIEILMIAGEKAMLVVDEQGNTPCHLLAKAGMGGTLAMIDSKFTKNVLGREDSGLQLMLKNACLQKNQEGFTPLMIALLKHPDNNDLIFGLSDALGIQRRQMRSFARDVLSGNTERIDKSLEMIKTLPGWNSEIDFIAELGTNITIEQQSSLGKKR